MALSARDLLNQDVEAASLGQFEAFNVLISLLDLLVVESQLAVGVITPYEDLSEIKVYRLLLSLSTRCRRLLS